VVSDALQTKVNGYPAWERAEVSSLINRTETSHSNRFVLAALPFALVVIYELRVWPSSVRGRPPGIETERRTSATLRPYHASSDFLVYSVLTGVYTRRFKRTIRPTYSTHRDISILPTGE
jgi:hypothetical protein